MTNRTAPEKDREYVVGLEKGLAVIEAFDRREGQLTLSEAAELTGLSRASARRSLRTLEALGYAASDGKHFRLTPRVLRLGHAYLSSTRLTRIVQPIVEATIERAGESMAVAVFDGESAVVIARAGARRSLEAGIVVGTRLPIHCSALGRVLLADLADKEATALLRRLPRPKLTPHSRCDSAAILKEIQAVRRQGYAVNDQEVQLGLRSIGVPILDALGRTVAAMSISAATSRMSCRELVSMLLPELETARRRIAALL